MCNVSQRITRDGITSDLTGEDWEPDASMRYFAQWADSTGEGPVDYAFGPTREVAIARLLVEHPKPAQ